MGGCRVAKAASAITILQTRPCSGRSSGPGAQNDRNDHEVTLNLSTENTFWRAIKRSTYSLGLKRTLQDLGKSKPRPSVVVPLGPSSWYFNRTQNLGWLRPPLGLGATRSTPHLGSSSAFLPW